MTRSLLRRAALAAGLALIAVPASAPAAISITDFSTTLSTAQAGAHPDLAIDIQPARAPLAGIPLPAPLQRMRDLQIDLPPGLTGDTTAVPRCTSLQFLSDAGCAYGTQVGTVTIESGIPILGAVWLLDPASPGESARLGIRAAGVLNIAIAVRPRSEGDFGLRATAQALTHVFGGIGRITMALWGDPASPAHDLQRLGVLPGSFACGSTGGQPTPCPYPAPALAKPFLSNPTACGPLAPSTLRVDSYEQPGDVAERSASFPAITGCDQVAFAPTVTVTPDDPRPDAPAGITVRVDVPQAQGRGLATANVKTVDLTLPPGMVVSPAGANGLVACSDAQLRLGENAAAECPGASSVATATMDVPILDTPLQGKVYLRPPQPGKLLRLAIVADGPGVHLKIPGEATPDPVTGQLRAVFDNAPQQPFRSLELHFSGGPQASLASPLACGAGQASGTISGYSGVERTVNSTVTFDRGCAARRFAPAVSAGLTESGAGRTSGFALTARRADGEQLLGAIDAQLPAGISAYLSRVPRCAGDAAAAGICPATSRIGSTTAGAGSGPAPVFLGGDAYLTDGFGGAPYGMVFVVPARIGPFDLGNVVVRARIFVDRTTAALRVVSDQLPTIIQGVPLRLRELRIAIDRPGFIVTPTSCAAKQVSVTTASIEGAATTATTPFAVTGCKNLGFTPKITAVTNARRNKASGASLRVSITQPAGQANLGRVVASLPLGLAARGTTISNACSAEQWQAQQCPASTRAGSATAATPILDQPLTAGVYFVARPKGQSGLPQLRMILRGSGLAVELTGDVTVSASGRNTTTFPAIPDVPISSFTLDLPQGPSSLLATSRPLCSGRPLVMSTTAAGQNGAVRTRPVAITATGCPRPRRASKARGAHAD